MGAVDVERASPVSDPKTGALLQGKPGRELSAVSALYFLCISLPCGNAVIADRQNSRRKGIALLTWHGCVACESREDPTCFHVLCLCTPTHIMYVRVVIVQHTRQNTTIPKVIYPVLLIPSVTLCMPRPFYRHCLY